MQVVILVGGQRTRLRPITYDVPKALMPLRNRPFVGYILNFLKSGGLDGAVLSFGYLPTPGQEYLAECDLDGFSVDYAIEDHALGTAGGIKNATRHLVSARTGANGYIGGHRIAYVDGIKYYEHLDRLVRMIPALREEFPNIRLDVARSGDALPAIEALVGELGLRDSVTVHGFVDERKKGAILSQASVFATHSMHKGWGLTVIEAKSYGRPAVAYDVPGFRAAIRHGETGLLAQNDADFRRALSLWVTRGRGDATPRSPANGRKRPAGTPASDKRWRFSLPLAQRPAKEPQWSAQWSIRRNVRGTPHTVAPADPARRLRGNQRPQLCLRVGDGLAARARRVWPADLHADAVTAWRDGHGLRLCVLARPRGGQADGAREGCPRARNPTGQPCPCPGNERGFPCALRRRAAQEGLRAVVRGSRRRAVFPADPLDPYHDRIL